MSQNELPDIIVLTVFGTFLLTVGGYFTLKAVRSSWKLFRDILFVSRQLRNEIYQSSVVLRSIQAEMAYMRSLAQQAQSEVPNPPVGRAAPMPGGIPPFPTPAWDKYPTAPDAKPEDTDQELLNQDDVDLEDAQKLEYLRNHGIEPDGEIPETAVRDDA